MSRLAPYLCWCAFVFGACDAGLSPNQPAPVAPKEPSKGQPEASGDRHEYGLTVAITSDDKKDSVEQRYGGQVQLWQPNRGFAVLGLDKQGAVKVQEDIKQGTLSNVSLETNKNKFFGGGQVAWVGGGVSAWAGGGVSAWAGGGVSAWAGGVYAPVPQNSSKWQKLNLQQSQAVATRLGADVKVAVIDTGLDLAHPAFQGALVSPAQMWDWVDNDAVPQETGVLGQGAHGHGTSVAGIVLQIAPQATILPLRVLGPDGSGDVLHVAAAINWAVKQGAKIINLSLGSDARSPAVASAIEAATAQGVYVISSSGNSADQNVTYPASEAALDLTTMGLYSLSVGSVDDQDQKSGFSSFGGALEVVAPGEQVYSPVPNSQLGAWTGTSMAAPMVSGALALALAQNLVALPADLTHKLKSRAVDIFRGDQNAAYDDLLGEGRLDILAFLNSVMN